MARITVRAARPGDGAALARIHGQIAAYYVGLAPDHFRMPALDGFARQIDAELASADSEAHRTRSAP